jgi:hypothetical protein
VIGALLALGMISQDLPAAGSWAFGAEFAGGDRWWPVALAADVTALLALVAVVLSARRDVGEGLLPARLGRASAAPGRLTDPCLRPATGPAGGAGGVRSAGRRGRARP